MTPKEKQKRLIKRAFRKASKAMKNIIDNEIVQSKSLNGINTQTTKIERANAVLTKALGL